jgi:anti-anti-sigma factor
MLLTVKREVIDRAVVITLECQSLEASNVQRVTRAVSEAMLGGERIIVDLGALQYFDVRGFAGILQWVGSGAPRAEVRLCSRSAPVRALFGLLGADAVIPLYQSREEALSTFDLEGSSARSINSNGAAA